MKTRLKTLAKTTLPLVAGAITFGAACSSQAALIIDETFTGPNDTLPANWTTPGGIPGAGYASIQGNRMRFQRTTSSGSAPNNTGQAAYYTGTGLDGSMTDGKIADFSASVNIETGATLGSDTSFGLMARDNNTSFSIGNGYYIAVKGGTTFGIWTNTGTNSTTAISRTTALDWSEVSLTVNTSYVLEVLAVGSDLSASLFAVDVNGNKTGVALGEISISDAATAAGYLGFHMGAGNTNQVVYFDNLQVQSIPEPATALLLLPAGAFLLYRKRRAA